MGAARRLAVVGAVTITLLIPAGSATAGGPTSVLIVSPQTGQTASLYATDSDYGLLAKALGESPSPDSKAPSWSAGPGTSDVNITWLVHDVAVWRIDHVVISADGGPWVQTRLGLDRGLIDLGQPGVWHRPAEPKVLLDMLARLEVLGKKAEAVASSTNPTPVPAATSPAAGPSAPMWWWVAPGLIVGIVIGALGRPVAGWLSQLRQRRADRGPCQQLVDLS